MIIGICISEILKYKITIWKCTFLLLNHIGYFIVEKQVLNWGFMISDKQTILYDWSKYLKFQYKKD